MFQWQYFFLFIFLGFLGGFSDPRVPPHKIRGIQDYYSFIVLFLFISLIWSIFTFGIFWGILSLIEIWAGYFFGRKVSLGE
tara:strand:- start:382 stop:624 length:243 start_codon:yes stop_codon:yes gene_type:complete